MAAVIAFVTPCHGRYELTALCFEQRARMLKRLRAAGVDAVQVVVGDDDNMRVAGDHGFTLVVFPNDQGLGRKFNAGWQMAEAAGASWICSLGSDSWVKPEVFLHDWDDNVDLYTAAFYCHVHQDGHSVLEARVTDPDGVGPQAYNAGLYTDGPADPDLYEGIDSSILRNLAPDTIRDTGGDPFQYVGFRSHDPHITPYERLADRWGVSEQPFDVLYDHYDHDLVDKAAEFYAH